LGNHSFQCSILSACDCSRDSICSPIKQHNERKVSAGFIIRPVSAFL
jgi:hypothetical protein